MADTLLSIKPAIDQFRAAIAEKGITPPDTIEADGKLHRFSSNGKPDDDAGWYVFHSGNVAAGAFGDFRTGQTVPSWVADIGRPLTPVEKTDFQKKQDAIRKEREAKQEQLRAEARSKAYRIIRNTIPADNEHPYLKRKDVAAHGISVWDAPNLSIGYSQKDGQPYLQVASQDRGVQVRFKVDLEGKSEEEFCRPWKNILIIPMRDESGDIQSLQFIAENGEKKFLYGGKMQGCYFTLGDIRDSETILIAEGYATAATIHEITGHPVVVAYNAGNLVPVAKAIRAQKPDAQIVMCADDDFKTKGNPGVTKAQDAELEVGGRVLIPLFGLDRPEGATDFNDMAAHLGKDAVTNFFTDHSLVRDKRMTDGLHDNDNEQEALVTISRPSTAKPAPAASGGRVITGTITDFGPAPYKNDPKNSPSYFIKVSNGEGVKTVWGVGLGKALVDSGFGVNDKIAIYDKGKVPVRVVTKTRDDQGRVIDGETKTVMKGAWYIGSLDEYIESRVQMAEEAAASGQEEPQAGKVTSTRQEKVIPAMPPRAAYHPELQAEPKAHFSAEDFKTIQDIWKNVPRQVARHSESGYDILIGSKSKVRVTSEKIELTGKPRHRLDASYVAACEHARRFWDGQMEIQGDRQHRVKAYAYATAFGVKVTNYTPNDKELLEANKIIESLNKTVGPGFRRPSHIRPSANNLTV